MQKDQHEFIGEFPAYAEEQSRTLKQTKNGHTYVCMSCAEGATRSRISAKDGAALPDCPSCGSQGDWMKV